MTAPNREWRTFANVVLTIWFISCFLWPVLWAIVLTRHWLRQDGPRLAFRAWVLCVLAILTNFLIALALLLMSGGVGVPSFT